MHRRLPRARRGGPRLRRRLRRRARARAARRLRPRADLLPRQRQVRRASCARRSRPGVGHIVLDSFDEFDRLERVAAELDRRQEVLIRVTPGVAGDTHQAISTGQADSKFGFSLDEARDAIERLRERPHLELVGLHFHIGSQLFELEPFRAGVRAIATLGDFPVYNLGGGLGRRLHRRPAPAGDRGVRGRARRHGPRRARAGQAAAARARARAGGQLDGHAVHGARRSSATSRPGSLSTAACRTTCARCCTAPCTRR